MSDQVDRGQPLKMLEVDRDGGHLDLDMHGLACLLLNERVKDKPVVVIAVAGAFRKGKSFLLCFLLRYLRSVGQAEWMGDPNAPLDGFEWRGGSDPHTSGILIWNEVFTVKTSRGEELAVLLMDTQGTLDCESASVVQASIFSLGAMISSMFIYNVSQNIQQDDLQHLKDFLEYGMLTRSEQQPQQPSSTTAEVGCSQPFQSLMFLVRDWHFEEPYGLEGGKKLLEKRLKGLEGKDKERRELRRKLCECFKQMRCFLMPYPGTLVAQGKSDGRLSDMDKTFKLHLFEFVQLLVNPDNLLPKEINGQKVTCQELYSYIQVYVSAINRGLLRDPSAMLQATYVGSCRAAMDKSIDFYTNAMLSLWQNSSDDDANRETMQRYHDELRKVAVEKYSAAPKMGGDVPAKVHLHKLLEKIDTTFDVYCEYLKEKKTSCINAAVFKHVAFKVVHGFVTTGLAAGVVALALVELPIVAGALGALGAVSLTGHLVQVVVDAKLAKRKKKERLEKSKAAAEAAKSMGCGAADVEDCDDETPLLAAEDDCASVLSAELPECSAASSGSPVTVTYKVEKTRSNDSSTAAGASDAKDCLDDRAQPASTEAANSAAFALAMKYYTSSMQKVCGDSIPRLSEEELQRYHSILQVHASNILAEGCSSAGNRELPEFLDRLMSEIEEQFKNFANQNREKPSMRP